MTVHRTPDDLDLARFLKPGDRIVLGQACGEPTTLVDALIAQGGGIGDLSAFIATSFSGLLTPEATEAFAVTSMGAIGALRGLAKAHRLGIIPCHVSQVGPMIENGTLPCDAAFVQVSPADADGNHSLGLVSDYVLAAVARARVVVAEANERVPRTPGATLPADAIDCAVHVSREPVEVPPAPITPVDEAIAAHAAAYVEDGSVLQTGVGAVPDALLRLLRDRRDLGVHSGMLGDGLVDLVEAGVVTNARKKIDRGVSINGALIGTRRLYDFAHRNPALRMCPTSYTHDPAVLARVERLVTVNSALEVDLTGQVNAEQSGPSYVGGTGGQVDFVRAGARSPGGHALMVLPSTAKNGTVSRITPALSGPVTTARTDVDVVITEYGSAELRGRSLPERARLLTAIAHPAFRDMLEEAARTLRKRGF
ncbi:acetyl-CoA hydrolase/transferase family protein [Actinocorallia sp. A-T 12471]|uniref:acetyl-CoA hydrolase/transferase family protein n=1 Tax=Actinocorallia sp. A-T 12471 TaxID=3089813 RepID=UPI0029CEC48B|nr:acetyl-CoA hydrolase/transferase C-terminal domain-containing protein [Actinocorallia sp. A-T 12471]MDX6740826.1 acetyl-CoA hydrolase/transferase C-terminal domain-containing protein [Actinocorallia sp. A-T 12471]